MTFRGPPHDTEPPGQTMKTNNPSRAHHHKRAHPCARTVSISQRPDVARDTKHPLRRAVPQPALVN